MLPFNSISLQIVLYILPYILPVDSYSPFHMERLNALWFNIYIGLPKIFVHVKVMGAAVVVVVASVDVVDEGGS